MSAVAKLPTAATSFYTVHKAGKRWVVVLVTPNGRNPIKTKLYSHERREDACEHGRQIAARTHRPFKARAAA